MTRTPLDSLREYTAEQVKLFDAWQRSGSLVPFPRVPDEHATEAAQHLTAILDAVGFPFGGLDRAPGEAISRSIEVAQRDLAVKRGTHAAFLAKRCIAELDRLTKLPTFDTAAFPDLIFVARLPAGCVGMIRDLEGVAGPTCTFDTTLMPDGASPPFETAARLLYDRHLMLGPCVRIAGGTYAPPDILGRRAAQNFHETYMKWHCEREARLKQEKEIKESERQARDEFLRSPEGQKQMIQDQIFALQRQLNEMKK